MTKLAEFPMPIVKHVTKLALAGAVRPVHDYTPMYLSFTEQDYLECPDLLPYEGMTFVYGVENNIECAILCETLF